MAIRYSSPATAESAADKRMLDVEGPPLSGAVPSTVLKFAEEHKHSLGNESGDATGSTKTDVVAERKVSRKVTGIAGNMTVRSNETEVTARGNASASVCAHEYMVGVVVAQGTRLGSLAHDVTVGVGRSKWWSKAR